MYLRNVKYDGLCCFAVLFVSKCLARLIPWSIYVSEYLSQKISFSDLEGEIPELLHQI